LTIKSLALHLLIGAGFSRNWGGWLASEAFEFLLGSSEVISDPNLTDLLWKHQLIGGFEGALEELQSSYERDSHNTHGPLMALEAAIRRMFKDMNDAFISNPDWEFQQNRDRHVGEFLTRFDSIYSLNQDLLIEHHYITPGTASLSCVRKWTGVQMPGLHIVRRGDGLDSNSWAKATWSPDANLNLDMGPKTQPFIKLHGSSNWERDNGSSLLIMGGGKAKEIGAIPLLKRYAEIFEQSLCANGARLMVIGYGFRDSHINEVIQRGVNHGLKLFVIAPDGAEIARNNNSDLKAPTAVNTEAMLAKSLIGISRRKLREIFGHDTAEYNKIMRFFD